MTLEALAERVGGLLLVGFDEIAISDATAQFIAETAGAILFRRNIDGAEKTRALVEELQAAARAAGRPPLLIAVDQEGGPVERLGANGTPPPSAMALGAAGDVALTRAVYRMIGDELSALGINLDLAPVADVNTESRNTAIGLRAFGDDPHAVGRHVGAAVNGLHDAGIGAVAKHFPGHGDTETDSHDALPVAMHDIERLRAVELLPFRAAIDADVDAIMTAHVALPNIEPDGAPATLSRALLGGVLRTDLRFGGVICTDDLEMQAITGRYTLDEAAVLAADAGADLLLFSRSIDAARGARDSLRRAVISGRLDAERVEASLRRVASLRSAHQVAHERSATEGAHATLGRDAANQAITLVRRARSVPPFALAHGARVFIVNFVAGGAETGSAARVHSALGKALAAGGLRVTEQLRSLDPAGHEYKQLLMAAGSADAFVAVTRRAFRHPLQAQAVADLAMFGKPMIAVAALEPYDAEVFPDDVAVVASFGDGDDALAAVADVILGVSQAPGRMPVALSGAAGLASRP